MDAFAESRSTKRMDGAGNRTGAGRHVAGRHVVGRNPEARRVNLGLGTRSIAPGHGTVHAPLPSGRSGFSVDQIAPETAWLASGRALVAVDLGDPMRSQTSGGQVHGRVARGLGRAAIERAGFDETGQLPTGSFPDDAKPRAKDLPMMRPAMEPLPATPDPPVVTGRGRAGTLGAPAATEGGGR